MHDSHGKPKMQFRKLVVSAKWLENGAGGVLKGPRVVKVRRSTNQTAKVPRDPLSLQASVRHDPIKVHVLPPVGDFLTRRAALLEEGVGLSVKLTPK